MTKLGEYVLSGQEINSNVVRSIDSIEGGGGGSSDFSTAEVTLIYIPHGSRVVVSPHLRAITVCDNEMSKECQFGWVETPFTHNFVLYKGVQNQVEIVEEGNYKLPIVTGGVSLGDGYFVITGPGSITLEDN